MEICYAVREIGANFPNFNTVNIFPDAFRDRLTGNQELVRVTVEVVDLEELLASLPGVDNPIISEVVQGVHR